MQGLRHQLATVVKPFPVGRGVRCGDISSPVIFNIVIDAIIRDVDADPTLVEALLEMFYADDGILADKDPEKVQTLTDAFTERFARVGLKMNDKKTKTMVL